MLRDFFVDEVYPTNIMLAISLRDFPRNGLAICSATVILTVLVTSFMLLMLTVVAKMLQGKKGVWIKLPKELVNLVESAVKVSRVIFVIFVSANRDIDYFCLILSFRLFVLRQEGFRYHHAEKNYLMLVYWIPDTPDTIPANATHRVGIGAVVINERNEVHYYLQFLVLFQFLGLF